MDKDMNGIWFEVMARDDLFGDVISGGVEGKWKSKGEYRVESAERSVRESGIKEKLIKTHSGGVSPSATRNAHIMVKERLDGRVLQYYFYRIKGKK